MRQRLQTAGKVVMWSQAGRMLRMCWRRSSERPVMPPLTTEGACTCIARAMLRCRHPAQDALSPEGQELLQTTQCKGQT